MPKTMTFDPGSWADFARVVSACQEEYRHPMTLALGALMDVHAGVLNDVFNVCVRSTDGSLTLGSGDLEAMERRLDAGMDALRKVRDA